MTNNRVPRGRPNGGEFAATPADESDVTLSRIEQGEGEIASSSFDDLPIWDDRFPIDNLDHLNDPVEPDLRIFDMLATRPDLRPFDFVDHDPQKSTVIEEEFVAAENAEGKVRGLAGERESVGAFAGPEIRGRTRYDKTPQQGCCLN